MPQVDHIFPQSLLRKVSAVDTVTGKKSGMRYHAEHRNQLANCMLLTAAENGAGGKGDASPDEWFKGKGSDYLDRHLIPHNPALWRLDRFEDFIAERKKLIRAKFAYLLSSAVVTLPVDPGADGSSVTT
jgi:hypothetical protein